MSRTHQIIMLMIAFFQREIKLINAEKKRLHDVFVETPGGMFDDGYYTYRAYYAHKMYVNEHKNYKKRLKKTIAALRKI